LNEYREERRTEDRKTHGGHQLPSTSKLTESLKIAAIQQSSQSFESLGPNREQKRNGKYLGLPIVKPADI
jgi:hypothetical protein